MVSPEQKKAQRVRLWRFALAASTYAMVIMATALVARLGLGEVSIRFWAVYAGAAVIINAVFALLFVSGANLRFPEPSLTREQMVVSAAWGMIPLYGFPEARPIILMFYLPAFSFGMFRLERGTYFRVAGLIMLLYASLLVAEYLQERPGFSPEYEIFLYIIYAALLSWFAFFGGILSNIRQQLRIKNTRIRKAHQLIEIEMQERMRASAEKDRLIEELRNALERIDKLSGLLPICASCKKIRDEKGDWKEFETYIGEHSSAEFSHGLCPQCARKLYPEFEK